MHVHILGICGTFMGGIAALAKASGHEVTGSDKSVYPPMSDQLAELGIAVTDVGDPAQFDPAPDIVVIGNVMSRGAEAVEHVLNEQLPYTSGPAWLAEHVLRERWVIAVAGTHGKTTTASLVAWLLEDAGLAPGFLIGGVPGNFGLSARLGATPFFVVEADEYDTAFFDKRSKFVHYRPRTLVLNNLEFDHADIFDSLDAIKRQFHHLVRTVPGNGRLIVNGADDNLAEVLAMGAWTPVEHFGTHADTGWHASAASGRLALGLAAQPLGEVDWPLPGDHNALNAAAACAACHNAGVPATTLLEGLAGFAGVKRRAELVGEAAGVRVFDDFAHHPTAIGMTLEGFRARSTGERVLAIVEPRSNTMRMGIHRADLAGAIAAADHTWFYGGPDIEFDLQAAAPDATVCASHDELIEDVVRYCRPGDQLIVMSNGGFGGIHRRLLDALSRGRAT